MGVKEFLQSSASAWVCLDFLRCQFCVAMSVCPVEGKFARLLSASWKRSLCDVVP